MAKSEVSKEVDLYLNTFFTSTHGFNLDKAHFQSPPEEIQRLLPSKTDGKGRGRPEMTYPLGPKGLLILEVKNDVALHSSVAGGFPVGDISARLKPKDYAEDGVVCYMQGLAAEYDVIGIAVSGQPKGSTSVSTFRVRQGGRVEKLPDTKILSADKYWNLLSDLYSTKQTPIEVREFGDWLHNYLRDTMKLSEADKPMLISAVLVALQEPNFVRHYRDYDDEILPEETITHAERVLEERVPTLKARGKVEKRQVMLDCFRSVVLKAATKPGLRRVIMEVERNIHETARKHHHFDILGHFYQEFLKYSGGDKKGLGIVLTPNHITSLFARLAEVQYGDAVLDTCTGTAGYLISAMETMLQNTDDETEKAEIRQHALLGIEFNENNYTLACANMLLRGDGKSNIRHGDCFDKRFDGIKSSKFGVPRVTFLNPPYNQKAENQHELDFIARACDLTRKGGTVIAIVPMSCVCEQSKEVVAKRAALLSKNTLTAVMSMPDGLFPKVGVVTCIMVFKAGVPHKDEDSTWFAYWKDDGFKLKKGVRYELRPWWDCQQLKQSVVDTLDDADLRERLAKVGNWVYPAGTFQPIDPENLAWVSEGKVRKKAGISVVDGTETQWFLDFRDRKEKPQYSVKVRLADQAEKMKKEAIADGTAALIAEKKLAADTMMISTDGDGSHTYAYVLPEPFVPNSNVLAAIPNGKMTFHEKVFYALAITLNRPRFSYGRKPKGERIASISLPDQKDIPVTLTAIPVPDFSKHAKALATPVTLPPSSTWKEFRLHDLFSFSEANGPTTEEAMASPGLTPFVSAAGTNNGVVCLTSHAATHPADAISLVTIGAGASGVAFLQPKEFCANPGKCLVLTNPRIPSAAKHFIATIITAGDWQFSYGRSCTGAKARGMKIRLPATADGNPDYALMERFIQGCRFSATLGK